MKRIYDDLKGLICTNMVSRASRTIGEKETNVNSAASSVIASLLGVMLKSGNTQQIENILTEAGNLDLLSETGNLCEERPSHDQQRIGDDFLQHLLGDKAAAFTDPIAKQSGISQVSTNRLVSIIAPVFAGYLGKRLVKDDWSMAHLMNEVENQKSSFAGFIPTQLIKNFGLTSILPNDRVVTEPVPEKKKSNSWLIWLILLILLLLLFLGWRSCRNRGVDVYEDRTTIVTSRDSNNINNRVVSDREMREFTLPNGVKINAYRNGTEEKMLDYLQSNKFEKATDDDFKKNWFVFDNINFEFNSGTDLMSGSQAQINNIAAILKAYPNAKVKVGGFADKVGTEAVNYEISRERAKTIENMLDKAGAGNQVVRIEGYGEEYATRNENDSDYERAKDRDIAIRFVK